MKRLRIVRHKRGFDFYDVLVIYNLDHCNSIKFNDDLHEITLDSVIFKQKLIVASQDEYLKLVNYIKENSNVEESYDIERIEVEVDNIIF